MHLNIILYWFQVRNCVVAKKKKKFIWYFVKATTENYVGKIQGKIQRQREKERAVQNEDNPNGGYYQKFFPIFPAHPANVLYQKINRHIRIRITKN